jgi:hypothetical protein
LIGIRTRGREIIGSHGTYELREQEALYKADFGSENVDLRHENAFFWDISV